MITKIKTVLEKADSRYKGLIILVCLYLSVSLSLTTIGAVSYVVDFTKSVNVQIIDGTEVPMNLVVKEKKLSTVLEGLEIVLGEHDEISIPLDQMIKEGDTVSITRISYSEQKEQKTVPTETVKKPDVSVALFSSKVTASGVNGEIEETYRLKTVNGEVTEKTLIDTAVITEKQNEIIGYGVVQAGAFFTGRLTRYGADCKGCKGSTNGGYGNTAAGLPVTIWGVNGNQTAKVNYRGQEYYVLAADPSIPFCSIIEVSNHNMRDRNGVHLGTFKGIVLDRGVYGTAIDLYSGGERSGITFASGGTSYNSNFKIVSVGSGGAYCFYK